MVGDGAMALVTQQRGRLFGLGARQAIDDAALAAIALDHLAQLFEPGGLGPDAEANVRPVESGDENLRIATEQRGDNVVARHLVGGRGHGGEGRVGEVLAQGA